MLDDDLVVVPAADTFLRHVRFGKDQAELTTRTYAGHVALYLRWCIRTGRDWRVAAEELGLFVDWLKFGSKAVTSIDRPAGSRFVYPGLGQEVDMYPSLGRIGTLRAAPVVALALVTASFTIGATPASAEVFCGSHSVDGAIWTEYTQTPGVQRSLGCPTTDELGTPDGIGRFQAFDNGSIYWTPDTGAHAVWGAIRQHWADLGWERGYLGYPLSDELTNPDGYGVRQQFQGGTVYWSQYSGAHAVHGLTGWWWGQNGYESGFYGYPTSDEYKEDYVGGIEDNNTGVRQNFQSGRYILYNGGQSNAFESCHTACIGYGGITNTKWVKKTEVYMNLADQNKRSTHVTPTDAAFASTSHSDTASSDSADNWKQVWSNTLMFPHATQGEMHSTYEQLYCHASYSYSNGNGGHWGGPTWDLEAWHYDMVPYDAGKALQTKCNWGE